MNLITAGCSFTDNFEDCGRWPFYLQSCLPAGTDLFNYGKGSSGNDFISRNLIFHLLEMLKVNKPQDIKAIVMWSGIERSSFFISKEETPDFKKFFQYENDKDDSEGVVNPANFITMNPNTIYNAPKDSGWVFMAPGYSSKNELVELYNREFHKYFYTDEQAIIESLEHMLRLQWFCEKYNIQLLNLTYMDIFHFSKDRLVFQDYPNTKYLFDMIDFTKWIMWKQWGGMYEFCVDNNLKFGEDNFHPTPESHKIYVDKFLYPIIRDRL